MKIPLIGFFPIKGISLFQRAFGFKAVTASAIGWANLTIILSTGRFAVLLFIVNTGLEPVTLFEVITSFTRAEIAFVLKFEAVAVFLIPRIERIVSTVKTSFDFLKIYTSWLVFVRNTERIR